MPSVSVVVVEGTSQGHGTVSVVVVVGTSQGHGTVSVVVVEGISQGHGIVSVVVVEGISQGHGTWHCPARQGRGPAQQGKGAVDEWLPGLAYAVALKSMRVSGFCGPSPSLSSVNCHAQLGLGATWTGACCGTGERCMACCVHGAAGVHLQPAVRACACATGQSLVLHADHGSTHTCILLCMLADASEPLLEPCVTCC